MLAAVFAFTFTSCGSTPKTEDTTESAIKDKVNEVENKIEEAVDNSSALERTEAARNAAIEAGADKIAENRFSAADSIYDTLKAQSESGLDISIPLGDVEKRYMALTAYAKALENKKKIEDNNLISYDENSYNEGCSALSDFENLNSSTNLLGTLMLDKANMANGKFINVLNKAYKQLAKEARGNAFKAKKDADAVKAGVAAKADYKKAVEEFKSGDQNYLILNQKTPQGINADEYPHQDAPFQQTFFRRTKAEIPDHKPCHHKAFCQNCDPFYHCPDHVSSSPLIKY